MNCPCGLPRAYADCCGRYHAGSAAPTAEALMRSRYVAYALKNEAYLLASWHASTRPQALDLAADDAKWIGLEIRSPRDLGSRGEATRPPHAPPGAAVNPGDPAPEASRATVEFVARFKVGGRAHRLHETSRFVCEATPDGERWFYVDGDLHDTGARSR